jgi:hypothetical protein
VWWLLEGEGEVVGGLAGQGGGGRLGILYS